MAAFARERRAIAERWATKKGVTLSSEASRFFDAAAAGDSAKVQELFAVLDARRLPDGRRPANVKAIWDAIIDTYGTAFVVATWPADSLVEYARSVLATVPVGAIYLAGTDPGRFVPGLFNDLSGTNNCIILTQNALVDPGYLDYVELLHGQRLACISTQDIQQAMQSYSLDAQRRARHDAENPRGPRLFQPDESLQVTPDGKVNSSGLGSIMAVNELLVRRLVEKNSGISFYLEETRPMKGLYTDALPAGPLLRLRPPDSESKALQSRATSTVELWQSMATQFRNAKNLPPESPVRMAWSSLARAHGGYFLERKLPTEAEMILRIALQISSRNEPAILLLMEHLNAVNRRDEAYSALNRFLRSNPEANPLLFELRQDLARQSPPP